MFVTDIGEGVGNINKRTEEKKKHNMNIYTENVRLSLTNTMRQKLQTWSSLNSYYRSDT